MAERKRKMVKHTSYEISNVWDLEGKLSSLACQFTQLAKRYGEDASLRCSQTDYETYEFYIESWRLETDAEFAKRLAKEKSKAERAKILREKKMAKAREAAFQKEAEERELYEQLKKKFEGK